jgi:alpha-beta hydrolase superfamily lysophospholipase
MIPRRLRIVTLLVLGVRAANAQESVPLGGRTVNVWRPAASTDRQPLLIFSHGFGGCGTQSRFLTAALAQRGYWVFAPNHRDAGCGSGKWGRPTEPFDAPQKWSDRTYADRAEDVRADLHPQIITYAAAFLDRYVRGGASSGVLTRAQPGVAELRHQ